MSIPPEIDEAVAGMVASRLGKAKIVRVVEHTRPNVPASRRRYFTHILDADGKEVRVFTKTAPTAFTSLLGTEAFLAKANFTVFRTPVFYGAAEWSGGGLATWESVAGRSYWMDDAPPSILNRLVRIAADVASATATAQSAIPTLDARETVFEQLSDKIVFLLKQLDRAGVEVDHLTEDAALYDRNEHRAFLRFDYLGKVLSHLDFGNGNVIYPPNKEKPVVIDWDTMGMAPPGGTLRKFAELEAEQRQAAADLFARLLAKQGLKVEAHDVLFTLCAGQGLQFLSWACRRGVKHGKKSANAIRRGFALLRVAQVSPWVPQILPELLEA